MGCCGDSNYPCANVCLPPPSSVPTGSMISATGSGWPLCLQWRPHQTQILQIRSELWPARLNRLSLRLMATAGWRSGAYGDIHIDKSTDMHKHTTLKTSQWHLFKGIHKHQSTITLGLLIMSISTPRYFAVYFLKLLITSLSVHKVSRNIREILFCPVQKERYSVIHHRKLEKPADMQIWDAWRISILALLYKQNL